MGNAYIERQRAVYQANFNAGMDIGIQQMWDCIQIVLRDPEVMGKDTFGRNRLERVYNSLVKVKTQYQTAFEDGPEQDYIQEKMDRLLMCFCVLYPTTIA